jgi:hypothetical protein
VITREEQRRIYRSSKDAERRYARMWGGERWGNRGIGHSDGDEGCPVSLEVKRSKKNRRVASVWIEQAWTNAEREGKPPVLVIVGHNDRHPIAVVDHAWLLELARRADGERVLPGVPA